MYTFIATSSLVYSFFPLYTLLLKPEPIRLFVLYEYYSMYYNFPEPKALDATCFIYFFKINNMLVLLLIVVFAQDECDVEFDLPVCSPKGLPMQG